jgi:hypothetical protein
LILEKIGQSAVVVADVTPVGTVSIAEHNEQPKKLINSNVAIELGYSLHALGDRGILMVLNEHYGGHSDLPFDLRGKAGPIRFTLRPDADGPTIAKAENSLKGSLKEALRLCISNHLKATPTLSAPPFRGIEPQDGKGRFVGTDTPLGKSEAKFPFEDDPNLPVFMMDGPYFWFRLLPTERPEREWTLLDLETAAGESRIRLSTILGHVDGRLKSPQGIARYQSSNPPLAETVSFLFRSGEAWSIDTVVMRPFNRQQYFMLNQVRNTLPQLARNLTDALLALGLRPPFKWIAGIEGTEGYRLAFDTHGMSEPAYPPLGAQTVVVEGTYSPGDEPSLIADAFSEKVFAECGRKVPPGLM